MIKKAIVMILGLIIGVNIYSAEIRGSEKTFPWRKQWNRHELYRMSHFYFEAGQAFEKVNKKNQAMHCYLHAANTSPYSDIGAKAREQLRKNYNKDFAEPKTEEIIAWLKTQPDLTDQEKAFIAGFEQRGTQTEQGQNQTTQPQTEQGQNQTTQPQTEQGQNQTTQPQTEQGQNQTNPPQTEQQGQTQSQEGVTDEEIRTRGERVPFTN